MQMFDNTTLAIAEDQLDDFVSLCETDANELKSVNLTTIPNDTNIPAGLGVIDISGYLTPSTTWLTQLFGMTGIDQVSADFRAMENDPTVNTILFTVNSGGGNILGVADLVAQIKNSKKRTAAFVETAASGAYWITSAVDKIAATPTAQIGSVGAITTIYKDKKSDKIQIVSSQSPNKRLNPESEAGQKELQTRVDDLAQVFIDSVATNRNTTPEKVQTDFGRGGVMIASKAKDAGMIDTIQSLDNFIAGFANNRTTRGNFMAGEKDLQLEAVEAERNRIRSIEAIAGKFANSAAEMRQAVDKVVQDNKFEAGATAESVSVQIVDALASLKIEAPKDDKTQASEDLVAAVAAKRKAADVATQVAASEDVDEAASSEKKVSLLAKAMGGR
jgi:ClpP class serine protease